MSSTPSFQFKNPSKNPMIPTVRDITPEELRENKKSVKIIDVRRPDEWTGEFGHIPEAELMTLDTLPSRLQEIPKDKTVVFVCRSGGRSAQATAFALENGYTQVYNMKGGMIAWTERQFEATERNV